MFKLSSGVAVSSHLVALIVITNYVIILCVNILETLANTCSAYLLQHLKTSMAWKLKAEIYGYLSCAMGRWSSTEQV